MTYTANHDIDPGLLRRLTTAITTQRVVLALDFDGTLAPLVPNPDDSRCTPPAAAALPRLAAFPNVELALISGRPVADLYRLAQPPAGSHLIGSHGAEGGRVTASGYESQPLTLSESQRETLAIVKQELHDIAGRFPKTWVEEKPAAAVLHTRPAALENARQAEQAALEGPAQQRGLSVLHGKSVVELSVLTATKGEAITRLRDEFAPEVTVFAGDDVTDEHGFRVLAQPPKGNDVGIKIGAGESAAMYTVNDPEVFGLLLQKIADYS